MKVVLSTFVSPANGGRKKFKKIEKSVSSINDLKYILHGLDLLKSTIFDDLTIYDDGTNDFIKFSISIVYENPK